MFRITCTCSEALAYSTHSRDTYTYVLRPSRPRHVRILRLSEFHIHTQLTEAHTRVQIHLHHTHAHTCAQATESST